MAVLTPYKAQLAQLRRTFQQVGALQLNRYFLHERLCRVALVSCLGLIPELSLHPPFLAAGRVGGGGRGTVCHRGRLPRPGGGRGHFLMRQVSNFCECQIICARTVDGFQGREADVVIFSCVR